MSFDGDDHNFVGVRGRERGEFFSALNAKLDRGARVYGEASFERPTPELLEELEAEALDLAGWGYILWVRLRRLRAAAQAVEPIPIGHAACPNCGDGCAQCGGLGYV